MPPYVRSKAWNPILRALVLLGLAMVGLLALWSRPLLVAGLGLMFGLWFLVERVFADAFSTNILGIVRFTRDGNGRVTAFTVRFTRQRSRHVNRVTG